MTEDLTGQPFIADDGPEMGITWTLGAVIGTGGTAIVHEAKSGDGRIGAVKVLSDHRFDTVHLRDRFERELRIMSKSPPHRHLIQVLAVGHVGEARALLMERADTSLYRLLETRATVLPLWASVELLMSILAGLASLHERGLVHRDITPKNILFVGNRVIISDFGTVRHVDDPTLTGSKDKMGSMIYISRQQFDDVHSATTADDVYSVGQVAWELLAGVRPVANPPQIDRLREDLPKPITDVVERMRSYERAGRPTDAREALAALKESVHLVRRSMGEETRGRLLSIWKDRQLAAIESLRETLTSDACELLANLARQIGPLRLAVEKFRGAIEEGSPPNPSVLLGRGSARFYLGLEQANGFAWQVRWLHNRLNGRAMLIQGFDEAVDLSPLVSCAALPPGALQAFEDDAFLRGAACADGGEPVALRISQGDYQVAEGSGELPVHRGATCPGVHANGDEWRCCACGAKFERSGSWDEHGRYDAVGCLCTGYAFDVTFDLEPWAWSRPMLVGDVASLEAFEAAFDKDLELVEERA